MRKGKTIGCALALFMATSAAHAQSACTRYENLQRAMIENDVRLDGVGLVDLGASQEAVQLWVAPDGTWAIIVVSETGIACIVAAGQNWISPARL